MRLSGSRGCFRRQRKTVMTVKTGCDRWIGAKWGITMSWMMAILDFAGTILRQRD